MTLDADRAVRVLLAGLARRAPAALVDCVVVALIYLAAALLRTVGNQVVDLQETSALAVIAGLLQVAANIFFQIYWREWSAAAFEDLFALAKATLASFAGVLLLDSIVPVHPIPYASLITGVFAVFVLEAAVQLRPRWAELFRASRSSGGAQNVIVVGAGTVGQLFARDLQQQVPRVFRVAAFLDDDPHRWGAVVRGARVVGGVSRLPELLAASTVDLVVIAIRQPPSELVRRVVSACEPLDIRVRAVAGMRLDPSDTRALRPLSIEELLGRDPVALDAPIARSFLSGRTVLVTGAAGSIGSEVVRQAARCEPRRLIALDVNENGLFDLREQIRAEGRELVLSLTDIRDARMTTRAIAAETPDVVIHAAAYKHVPILEEAVAPAILTNVVGTTNVLQAVATTGVRNLVFISSDKAVQPGNVLGLTKRFGELLTIAHARSGDRHFAVVRFGNVLGSSGSVVPTFEQQIDRGGPVTVTHPDATRYFMTIPEAVALVIQAGAIARPADLLVLDMGAPLSIAALARRMIRLRGLRTPTDIPITFTGLRPGEKLHEELFTPDEHPSRSEHPRILRADASGPVPSLDMLNGLVAKLEHLARTGDAEEALVALRLAVRADVVGHSADPAPRRVGDA